MDDMKIAAYRVFGFIAALGVWLYLMFVTRRTVLRIFGWTMAIFAVGFFFIHINIQSNMLHSRAVEPVRIVNDLRNLKSAAHMFYEEFETWPLPGQEASLDAFCDRPMVLAESPRYAKVTLADRPGDADVPPEIYVGVELIPQVNGTIGIQKALSHKAAGTGLLQQPVSGDIYKSGLNVYMLIGISAEP